jgi:hypothetical protein
MTDDRTLERAARLWLEVGPTQAPPRAVEAALLRIQTTPQERDLRIPWRHPMLNPVRFAAAAVVAALVIGGALFTLGQPRQPAVGGPSSSPTAPGAATPSAIPSREPGSDYSSLPGTILIEHLGNAPDLTELDETDVNPERRRFYFIDPADMTARTVSEFLPGEPETGKFAADVAPDGSRIVFQDWKSNAQIYEANVDGTGLRLIGPARECLACADRFPAYDPAASRVAFVHVEDNQSWLAIQDLASGTVTRLESTVGRADDALPEQPTWSPDGTRIAFSRITWSGGESWIGIVHAGDHLPASGTLSIVDVATDTVTDLDLPGLVPGDADWSPDGSTILFSAAPLSTAGSVDDLPHDVYSVRPDGSGLQRLAAGGGASWTPDGERILYFDNYFWMMSPDGSDKRPVDIRGQDLSEVGDGFAYIGHWIDNP